MHDRVHSRYGLFEHARVEDGPFDEVSFRYEINVRSKAGREVVEDPNPSDLRETNQVLGQVGADETCSASYQHFHGPKCRAQGVLEQVVMGGQVRQASERLSNLWSRKVRRRAGRFPMRWASPESIGESSIPDLVSPYGWGIARRGGTISINDLQNLDPLSHPDRFRTKVQGAWAVAQLVGELSEADEALLRHAAAVGTPVLDAWARTPLLADRAAWERESFLQWSSAIDLFRLEPYWAKAGRPQVSITIPTRRPENLDLWTAIVASQTYRPLQVVAGLHGSHWTPGQQERIRRRLTEAEVEVELVELGDDALLGEVLNALTARADGEILIKWDDDDLYSTTHVMDLLRARHYSGATVVGKAAEFIYLQGSDITVRRHQAPWEIFSPTIAGSTLTMARDDLLSVGGWDAVPTREDASLIEKIRRAGGSSYRTAGFGFLIIRGMDSGEHTWNLDAGQMSKTAIATTAGIRIDWAMIDLPDHIIQRVSGSASGESKN